MALNALNMEVTKEKNNNVQRLNYSLFILNFFNIIQRLNIVEIEKEYK